MFYAVGVELYTLSFKTGLLTYEEKGKPGGRHMKNEENTRKTIGWLWTASSAG